MRVVVPALLLAAFLSVAPAFGAEQAEKAPNVSFGMEASGSYNGAFTTSGKNAFNPSWGYGGGFVVETMFNNNVGLHSGLSYNESHLEMRAQSWPAGTDFMQCWYRSLDLPLYLLLSINKGIFSFNLLLGITVGYVMQSYIEDDSSGIDLDVLRWVGALQFGVGGGMHFKFRVGKFVDIYFGVQADLYVTDFLPGDNQYVDTWDHLYRSRGVFGFLLRTNIFPKPRD